MLEELVDQPFGPYPFHIGRQRVAEFVAASSDDSDRWTGAAPPGFAAAGMFAAAAPFLTDPAVRREARSILHGEQTFRWFAPLELEASLEVTARLRRLRRRGDTAFVWLATALAQGSAAVVEADSLFLLSSVELVSDTEEISEPMPEVRGSSEAPHLVAVPRVGEALPPLLKSASRADLLRYAAATGDWNPIHWDHGSAVDAGLPGVICHGLLMAAWALQSAGRTVAGVYPLAEARVRFRAPLRPAEQATVEGHVTEAEHSTAALQMSVTSAKIEHVAATVIVRSG